MPKEMAKLPGKTWQWTSEWTVLRDTQKTNEQDGTYDVDGWQYSTSFAGQFCGTKSLTDLVRRRKWCRTCVDSSKTSRACFKEVSDDKKSEDH